MLEQAVPLPKAGDWAKEKFKGKTGSLREFPNAWEGIFPDEEIIESLVGYAAGLSFVDEETGRILKTLEETGQLENPLILYTSDHGNMMGDHQMWRKTRPYEASVHVPMIIRWPESMKIQAKRGRNASELVEMRDIFPAFAAASGISIPVRIDGRNMLKALQDGTR